MLEQLKKNLEGVVQKSTRSRESPDATQKCIHRVKINKIRTRKELRVNIQVVGFQIKDTVLDLESDVTILPRKTWEALGRPRLRYSPIQIQMANQYYIVHIGRLEEVDVDIVGLNTYTDFEVIDIMGDKDPYPALLGID